MSDKLTDCNRRSLIKLSLLGFVAPVLGRLTPALAAEQLDEAAAMAQQLNYKHDASQATDPKRKPDQFCDNCQLFQGKAGDEWAGCPLFQDKLVNAKGWCNAWVPKA